MKKLGSCLCDRCCKIIGAPGVCPLEEGINFISKNKKTRMNFCNEKCKIVFLKSKKYYNNKIRLQNEAFDHLMKLFEKCL